MALTKVKAGNILLTTPGASSNDVTPATTQYVTTALANLADSAPSTLNTLNELAAALGDDANFSTTVTNSIATKAPLASPTFTTTITTPDINITGGSQIGQDYAYLKSNSTSNASLTLRKDSSGADSIDFLQLRSDGNGLIGKIEGDGDISFKNATLSGNLALSSGGTITQTVASGGGVYHSITHTGNESWSWAAQSGSGSDDYLDVGISGGTRAMSWHEDGKIGIGTTSPDYNTEIEFAAGNHTQGLSITNSQAGGYGSSLYFTSERSDNNAHVNAARIFTQGQDSWNSEASADSNLFFATALNGSLNTRMTIKHDGKVGIGTTGPSAPLTIQSDGTAAAIRLVGRANGNDDESVLSFMDNNGSTENCAIISVAKNLTFYANSAERMRIDSSGRVGIAQDTPGDFNSGANALVIGNSSGSTGITIRTGTGNTGNIFFADGTSGNQTYRGAIQYTHTDDALVFGTNGGTERMRVDSTGRLVVGGLATSGSSGGVTVSSASSGYRHMYIWNSGMYFWNGANEANLSSGGAWNNASDERLKENITDIPYGLAEVKQLQPKKYSMITGGEEQVGLIAQEVETIIPELVTTSGEANMKSLSYGNLNAVLIKAIQEQQTIIESLTARITTLEG